MGRNHEHSLYLLVSAHNNIIMIIMSKLYNYSMFLQWIYCKTDKLLIKFGYLCLCIQHTVHTHSLNFKSLKVTVEHNLLI